ncbi:MAG: TSUP family transporter [Synechococcus sp.]
MELGDLLVAVPLGLLAGALAGLLGIGGGLIFAPLLLWMGLPPHQALATSTFAIVPTALGGTVTHWRQRTIPVQQGLAIGLAAFGSALLFSRLGRLAEGWQLLLLQCLMYVGLTVSIRADTGDGGSDESGSLPWAGLVAVGGVAGLAGGMLGLGGGLVMVPLMVRTLAVPIRLAIRFSTLAVACSATAASLQFLAEMRGDPAMGLLLGGTAALAAQWSASHLDRSTPGTLAALLRGLALILALDSGRRAIQLALAWP